MINPVVVTSTVIVSVCHRLGSTCFVSVSITNYTCVPLCSVSVIVHDEHYHHYNDWQYDDDSNDGDKGVHDDCGGGGGGGGGLLEFI